MKMMRAYRMDGACLSVRFGESGHLSTAIHQVGMVTRNAAPQLPGLNESNAAEYLCEMGYFHRVDDVCKALADRIDQAALGAGMATESVRRHRDGFIISVVDADTLSAVCAVRKLLAFYDPAEDVIDVLDAESEGAVIAFAGSLKVRVREMA